MMNKLSLALNGILLVAVGVLYYFHFSGKKDEVVVDAALLANRDSVSRNLTMVYVNIDTLLNNYKLVEELNEDLEARRKVMAADVNKKSTNIENSLNKKAEDLQRRAQDFQEKAAQMSEAIAQIKMQNLQEEEMALQQEHAEGQQVIYELKEKLGAQLMEAEAAHNEQVHKLITDELEKYNKEHNYTFILARGTGAGVLLAHPALDITAEILAGLNKDYEEKKKEEKK